MKHESGSSQEIRRWLDALHRGDEAARDRLIASARDRLIRLTRRMLADFPGVHRWEDTDDVFQNAMIRLCRTLQHIVPHDTTTLIRLTARDIRCALIDLARHYDGPLGHGANHESHHGTESRTGLINPPDERSEPNAMSFWADFHEQIQLLPQDQQDVMNILWYQGLTQAEAAELLNVSERTIQRRWRQICVSLHENLGELPPGFG